MERKSTPPKPINTIELCKELVIMAAFLEDRRVAKKIYEAVRQLQLLDAEAVKAGILSKPRIRVPARIHR